MIQARELRKTYNGHVEALKGVSFDVAAGEIFGFLGPNGAGKTTTVRILSGQMDPTSGRAVVAGREVPGDRSALHGLIGVLFENQNLYEEMTGRENLRLFCDLYRQPQSRVQELLERVEMAPKADERVKKYSKGMKQRIAFARALLPQPKVLFLDEPTSGLDPASAVRLREVVRDLSRIGTTVFITTHNMEEADQLCDRVAIINEGCIVALDTPGALKAAHAKNQVEVILAGGDRKIISMKDPSWTAELASVSVQGVQRIATLEPSLEDVFIQMTGRGLQ